jgi:hypothetical protein
LNVEERNMKRQIFCFTGTGPISCKTFTYTQFKHRDSNAVSRHLLFQDNSRQIGKSHTIPNPMTNMQRPVMCKQVLPPQKPKTECTEQREFYGKVALGAVCTIIAALCSASPNTKGSSKCIMKTQLHKKLLDGKQT